MKNKKAMAISVLITLILAVIILGMFIYIGYLMSTEGTQAAKLETCRMTLWANAGFRERVTEGEHVAINCPKKIQEVNDKLLKDFQRIERGTEEEKKANSAKRLLAEEMRECWYKGHEGTINPFPEKSGKFCLVCSQISFDKKVKENYKNVTNFFKYVTRERMLGSNITYFEYFSGATILGDLSKLNLHGKDATHENKKVGTITDDIDLSKEYSTLFIVKKENVWQKTTTKYVGLAGGSFMGGALAWGAVTLLVVIPFPGTRIAAIGAASALIAGVGGTLAGGYAGTERGYSFGKKLPNYFPQVTIVPYTSIYDLDCTYLIDYEEGETYIPILV